VSDNVLDDFELTTDERLALEQQGFVSGERRDSGAIIYKLRFRLDGRQRVVSLGGDLELIARVRQALQDCQQRRRWKHRLASRAKVQRALGRKIRSELAPVAAAAGYWLHGRRLRRRRAIASTDRSPNKQSSCCLSHVENPSHGGVTMIARQDPLTDQVDARETDHRSTSANVIDLRQQLTIDCLAEAETKLTAFERAISVTTAFLIETVGMYRQDLDEFRAQIQDVEKRLRWMNQISEQVYKLCKQIDSFMKTNLKLERERLEAPAQVEEPERRPK